MDFKLQIQGLGKIEDLTLNIKPLTVIAGENSSGKTFATKSIYSVLEALNQNQLSGALQEKSQRFYEEIMLYERYFLPAPTLVEQKFLEDIKETSSEIFSEIEECLHELDLLEHDKIDDLLSIARSRLKELQEVLHSYVTEHANTAKANKQLLRIKQAINCLEEIDNILINHQKAVSRYIAKSLSDNFKKNYQVTSLSQLVNKNNVSKASIKLDGIGELLFHASDKISFEFHAEGISEIQKLEQVVFIDSPVYLRIRQGLQKYPRGLFRRGPLSRELKGYPEYIDNLYDFIDRKNIDKPADDFLKLSQKLQHTMTGKLEVNKAGEINYHDEVGEPTPLSLAATGISNLGLLDLLIRNHIIKQGSFLIIDEPEAHIHPKWQVLLMDVLYEMAKAGVNVIIATHSLDMLKKLEMIVKYEDGADKIISLHRMPNSELPDDAELLDKIEESLTDLSTPFYEMYLKDNF